MIGTLLRSSTLRVIKGTKEHVRCSGSFRRKQSSRPLQMPQQSRQPLALARINAAPVAIGYPHCREMTNATAAVHSGARERGGWPTVVLAQQAAVPVIGFLSAQSSEDDYKSRTVPFLQGLKETGYVEGQNVAVEYRYAENQLDRLPALAADLVRRRVAVIFAGGTAAALAARAATTTIPIVFGTGGDPVALGLVASINRPGGNLTGNASLVGELAPKRLQLLRELLPNAALFGVLADPAFPVTQSTIADLQAAAHTMGLQLIVVNASTDPDLEPAFATFSQQHVAAVLVSDSTLYTRRTEQLAALAARHALPAIFPFREDTLAGGLMCYGSSLGYGGCGQLLMFWKGGNAILVDFLPELVPPGFGEDEGSQAEDDLCALWGPAHSRTTQPLFDQSFACGLCDA